MEDSIEELKRKIVEILKTHPQGLTIKELSELIGMHRQTVTKYVLVLEALGTIHRRRVGSATLHYIKKDYKSGKGQASSYLIVSLIAIITGYLVLAVVDNIDLTESLGKLGITGFASHKGGPPPGPPPGPPNVTPEPPKEPPELEKKTETPAEEKARKGREEAEQRKREADEKLNKIKEEAAKTRAVIIIPPKYKDAPVNFEFPPGKIKIKTPLFKSWDRKLVVKGLKFIEKNETGGNVTVFRDVSASLPSQFSLFKPIKWEKLGDDPNFDLTDVDASFNENKFTIKFKVSNKIVTNIIITDYYNSLGLVQVFNDGSEVLASRVSPVSKVFFAAPDEQFTLTGDVKFFPALLGLQVGEEFYYFMTTPFYPRLMNDTSALKDVVVNQSRTKYDIDFQYQLGNIKIIKATVPKVLDLSAVEAGYKEDILTINETDYTSVIISLSSNVLDALRAYERTEVTYPQESQAIVCHYWDFENERCTRNWETVVNPQDVGLSAFGFIVPKKVEKRIEFDRNFVCKECQPNQVSPNTNVTVAINVTSKDSIGTALFADFFPREWELVDANFGKVSVVNNTSKIEWNVTGNRSVSRTYVLMSPNETTPPADYVFKSQLNAVVSDPWTVTVSVEEIGGIIFDFEQKRLTRLPKDFYLRSGGDLHDDDKHEWKWNPISTDRYRGNNSLHLNLTELPTDQLIFSRNFSVNSSFFEFSFHYKPLSTGNLVQVGIEVLFEDGTGDDSLGILVDEKGVADSGGNFNITSVDAGRGWKKVTARNLADVADRKFRVFAANAASNLSSGAAVLIDDIRIVPVGG